MGGELFGAFPELIAKADEILGYSIKNLCLEDPNKELGQTQFTQPAIFTVNALTYYKKLLDGVGKPDYVLGHSLGEYSALLVAECFDFETGLKLVKKRGELMSKAEGGGMAAVLNSTKEDIVAILKKNNLESIDLANFNTPSQIVISGLKDDIARAQQYIEKEETQYIPLNTSGAFHSRYMQFAKDEFEIFLKDFEFSNPNIPVISNVTASPYNPDNIIENMANQIVSSVRWCESIDFIRAQGEIEFEEIGYGFVLTRMVQKIKEELPETSVSTQSTEGMSVNETDRQEGEEEKQSVSLSESPIRAEWMSLTAEQKVTEWNKRYPIGTRVKSSIINDDNLETETAAMVLFGHRAAVYMKNYKGYFDLDEVQIR